MAVECLVKTDKKINQYNLIFYFLLSVLLKIVYVYKLQKY